MLAVFFGCAGVITVWLWFRDKALLERRVKAGPGSEPDPTQNVVEAWRAGVPGDLRRARSRQALRLVARSSRRFARRRRDDRRRLSDCLLHLPREHLHRGHDRDGGRPALIDSGPYAVVRHPMYAGALIMIAGYPWRWARGGADPGRPARPYPDVALIREEAFLTANLAGYDDYRGRVRYRLAPIVWWLRSLVGLIWLYLRPEDAGALGGAVSGWRLKMGRAAHPSDADDSAESR